MLPEGQDFTTGAVTCKSNSLRPKLADAVFNHWLLDCDRRWRKIGRTHYLNRKAGNRAPFDYRRNYLSIEGNVLLGPTRDRSNAAGRA